MLPFKDKEPGQKIEIQQVIDGIDLNDYRAILRFCERYPYHVDDLLRHIGVASHATDGIQATLHALAIYVLHKCKDNFV